MKKDQQILAEREEIRRMGKKKSRDKTATQQSRKALAPRGSGGGWILPVLGTVLIGFGALTFWDSIFSSPSGGGIQHRVPGGERRPPLSPAFFGGAVARAYLVAREIPEVLDKIYCYCKCIENSGHLSNLSCFTDRHGAG